MGRSLDDDTHSGSIHFFLEQRIQTDSGALQAVDAKAEVGIKADGADVLVPVEGGLGKLDGVHVRACCREAQRRQQSALVDGVDECQ